VYHFLIELGHLLEKAPHIDEKTIMLTVLGLIDVVMIANLLIMVIVGGYETLSRACASRNIRINQSGSPT
jgi:uncharacterized protein (TIGR00645 family)